MGFPDCPSALTAKLNPDSGFYDITIAHSFWNYEFHFECKNLDETSGLINKYVYYDRGRGKFDGGVYRYFNGKYSQKENFGGMLGYILKGKTSAIKAKICKKLEEKYTITPEGDLHRIIDSSIEKNNFTFESLHNRNSQEFSIHHLLFVLN